MDQRFKPVTTTAILLALAMVAAGLTTSPASAQTGQATETAATVEGVNGVEQGEVLTATTDGFTAEQTDSSVTIPNNASGELEITTNFGDVAIGIPGHAGHDGVLVGANDVVYDNVVSDTNIIVQATEDGAQILLTLESNAAPSSFDFPVQVPDNGELRLNADGSVSIMQDLTSLDGATAPVETGTVATPWATDANGTPVPTHFTVNGMTLTQHIGHNNTTAYPVVADPKYSSSWWGSTIKLNTEEYKNLDAALIAGQGAAALATYVCAAGVVSAPCAAPSALGAAIITFGRAALKACSNSKGVDIHTSRNFGVGSAIWCSGY